MPEPVMGSLAVRLAAVLVLVAANAFFVAAEFALVAARRTRIEELIRRGDRKAKTEQQALQDLYRQLSAAQLGITVASILLGYVAEDTVAHLFRQWFAGLPPALDFLTRGGIASVVAVAIISFLHVVFGEQAPKAWAITYPERTSRWIARPLILFSWIPRPFTDTLNWSANRAVRRPGTPGPRGERGEAGGCAAARRVRPRHPGGRGRANRHEAPEDPSRDGARRVRRHRGPRHDGRSAGGDRRPDLRRVRPPRRGREASRDAGCRVAARGIDAAPGRERHFRARARRGRLHDDRRLPVRSAGPAPQGGRPGRGSGRRVRDRGDGRAPGGRRAAGRPGGDVKLRSTIAPIPPGALDLAGEAVRRRRTLQRAALERLGAAGYEEIIPPTFEYAEVFVRAAGAADLADRLIRFFDLDGKLLALRYDFTASVARLAATKLADRPTPLRLCYSGAVFRQDPERANGGGRPREILQVGAELLGDATSAADVEVLRLALELVRRASPQEYQVNLGHVGALAPALDALPPEERTRVRRLIDRKDAAGLATAAPGSLTELPFIIGRREALDRAQRVAPDARAAIDRLREIDAALADEERRHVVYDFGEVRGRDHAQARRSLERWLPVLLAGEAGRRPGLRRIGGRRPRHHRHGRAAGNRGRRAGAARAGLRGVPHGRRQPHARPLSLPPGRRDPARGDEVSPLDPRLLRRDGAGRGSDHGERQRGSGAAARPRALDRGSRGHGRHAAGERARRASEDSGRLRRGNREQSESEAEAGGAPAAVGQAPRSQP